MHFSFFYQKNCYKVNTNFHLYIEYEMSIFDVNEQSRVQNSIVADKKQLEHIVEPINKFKVSIDTREFSVVSLFNAFRYL